MCIFLAVHIFFIFFQVCTCIPSAPPQLRHTKRGNDPSSRVSLQPIFNTTALYVNGTSKQSPNVQTKVYIPPSSDVTSNLTDRQKMGERRILTCESPTATFHHSHCRHRTEVSASIREYIVWCREPVASHLPRPTFTLPSEARAMASSLTTEDTSLHAEIGICDTNEVCIDSLYSVDWRQGMVLIANCVKKSLFEDAGLWDREWDFEDDDEGGEIYWTGEWGEDAEESMTSGESSSKNGPPGSGSEGKKSEDPAAQKPPGGTKQQQSQAKHLAPSIFAGKYASLVVTSDEEGTTPLQVQGIGLRSLENKTSKSVAGDTTPPSASPSRNDGSKSSTSPDQLEDSSNENPTPPEITEQERNCTNCIDLKTIKPFSLDTKALEMEVKLAGAGTTALAGVLWLALLSG